MKTNYLSAPLTGLDASLGTIVARDSRSPAISQKETKRTKVRGVGFAFLLAVFVGACVTTELRAQVIVVPNSLATNDGETSSTTPAGPAQVRNMKIYDASQFGALSGPALLTRFAWRPDSIPNASGPRTVTLRIYASTTSRSVAGLSMTFADNVGTNNTLVFNGTLIWTTQNLPGPGNTRQFDIVFPFTTPFLYDPAAGNLLLEFQQYGEGSAITYDRTSDTSLTRQVVNTVSSNAPTAAFDPGSQVVTQFTFEPPPRATVVPGQSYLFPGADLTLGLNQTFDPPPAYQWQFNGANLPGATGPTLVLSNVTTNDSGLYRVTLSNAFEVVTTAPATVQVVDRVTIISHPRNTNAPAGSNVTFSVTALSPWPVTYQWQRNSTNLPGATNASLSFTNVQFDPHTGYYCVLVSDTVSNVLSETATLIVPVRPTITSQPVAQTVLQGGTAVFSVSVTPNHPLLPLNYRWQRQGVTFLTNAPPTLVITNVQPGTAGSFRVTVTNLAGGVNSFSVNLTVLPNFDGDGMADTWEILYGFDTNNVADARLDFDSDGMINRDEYAAGTHPLNTASVLKLQLASQAGGEFVLTFLAISNRTYSVEWNTQLTAGFWSNLVDVLAQPADRIGSVTDTNVREPALFYRVVTPRRP